MCDPGLESGLSVSLAGSYVERSIGKGVNPVKDGAYWKVVKSLGRCPWKELMWFWLDQLVPKRVGSYKKKKKKKARLGPLLLPFSSCDLSLPQTSSHHNSLHHFVMQPMRAFPRRQTDGVSLSWTYFQPPKLQAK
jgi:hypothetical protein